MVKCASSFSVQTLEAERAERILAVVAPPFTGVRFAFGARYDDWLPHVTAFFMKIDKAVVAKQSRCFV